MIVKFAILRSPMKSIRNSKTTVLPKITKTSRKLNGLKEMPILGNVKRNVTPRTTALLLNGMETHGMELNVT